MSTEYSADATLTDVKADEAMEDLVNKSRFKQLTKRREEVFRVKQRGPAMSLEHGASEWSIRYMYDQTLRGLVDDLRPTMLAAASDDGPGTELDYWRGRPEAGQDERSLYIEATIDPPDVPRGDEYTYRGPFDDEWTAEPRGVKVAGYGVSSIRAMESPRQLTWRVREDPRQGAPEVETVTEPCVLPRTYLNEIFDLCNEFMQKIDLDVAIGGGVVDEHADPF